MLPILDTTITLPPPEQLLILLLVGLLVGLLAETIVGTHMPLGYAGAVILGILGAWLATHVLSFSISPEFLVGGVPILRALIGAVLLAFIFALAMGRGRWYARR
jgi:uncharacterized membrane protein YeaQ/YmgE (transglycosylase-associated protein family)